MLSRKCSVVVMALAALLLVSATPTEAKKKKKKKGGNSTAPGKYTDWRDEVDKLEILATFQRSGFQKVVVTGFDTSNTPLPDSDDNTYEPVKAVLAESMDSFVEGLREEMDMMVEKGQAGADVLVVSVVVEEMDPGSRSARYFAGFGAGAARTVLQIVVKDGGTGKTLLEMKQERRSGVGVGGGKYDKLLHRNLRKIGEDMALVLNAF